MELSTGHSEGPGFVGIRFCQVMIEPVACCGAINLKLKEKDHCCSDSPFRLGVQQHAVSERRQGEQSPALCVSKL